MKNYMLHFIQTYNLQDKNRDEIERNQGERLVLVEYYKS